MPTLVLYDVNQQEQRLLSREFSGRDFDVRYHEEALDVTNASEAQDADGIGVFIRSHVTAEVLDQLPQVKVVVAMSTGFDHIDLDTCRERNVTVCNVPSYGDNTVAEYAFGLIIALARRFKETFGRVERGYFSRSGLMGMDLRGKTLGLVGTGRIGAHMARLGWAFEMKVIAYDLRPSNFLKEKFGVSFMSLEDLLKQADIVSLHIPYLPSTHHIINAERLRLMKRSALLINTARGRLVDTEALATALREHRLAGVGLDTFEGENIWIEEEFLKHDDLAAIPLREAMENFLIMRSERTILTPHNAFNTNEALERILIITAEDFKAFFDGSPKNIVDKGDA